MNSPDVVAAPRAGAPDAAGQLYHAYAEGLYQYCWLVLRSRQRAQVVMRDAVVLAGVRLTELRDPSMLKAWLFAIARAECDRHRPGSAGESDEPVARPQQRDAVLRIMAWNSVLSLTPDEREALGLVTRHGMTPPEVALVLGMPAPEAPALIATARLHLEQALAAEILINREGQECAGRAEALRGWTGTVPPAVRERLLRHAGTCPACLPRLPRNVSAARIFGLLPHPALTDGGWPGVLSLSDLEPPDAAAPALLGAGTPDTRRRGRRVCAGVVAAVAAAGVAAALAAGSFGGHAALNGAARHLPAVSEGRAPAGAGQPVPRPDSGPVTPGAVPRHASSSSRPASAGAGPDHNDQGQLTRATALAARSVITPARAPQRASNIALLPGAADPVAPAPRGGPAQAPGPPARPAAPGQHEVSPSRSAGTASAVPVTWDANGEPPDQPPPGRHQPCQPPPSPAPAASQPTDPVPGRAPRLATGGGRSQ